MGVDFTLSSTLCGTLGFLSAANLFYERWRKKRISEIKKANEIDILHKNHLLSFGLRISDCQQHIEKEFDCGNLDCNYGRLSYILSFINNCQSSLDVCIYIITAKLFGDCIIKAYQRGVTVRVIADADMSFSAQSFINCFRAADIPTRQRKSPFIMHHKFIIIDNEVLINGSMNFTMTGAFCNWENVMVTSQPELVNEFKKNFNKLWEDFSPKNYYPKDVHRMPHHIVNL